MSLTKRALFLLPPTNFPIQVTVRETYSDNGDSLGDVQLAPGLSRISFSKDAELRLKSFKSWLSHQNFNWSGQEILVPSQCVIFSVAEKSHASDQPETQKVAYTFLDKKYKSQKVNTISCGEYCVWSSEHKLVLGKVEFIGVPCEKDAGSTKLYAFVLSDTYLAGDESQRDVKSDGVAVYEKGLDEIFSITDLQKLQNNTFNAQPVQSDSKNLLQLTVVSHTSPSSPLNINENHFSPALQPTSLPDCPGSSFQMMDSDGNLSSLVRRIITNEENKLTPKVYPKLDSVKSEQSKEEQGTVSKCLPDPNDENFCDANARCDDEAMDTSTPGTTDGVTDAMEVDDQCNKNAEISGDGGFGGETEPDHIPLSKNTLGKDETGNLDEQFDEAVKLSTSKESKENSGEDEYDGKEKIKTLPEYHSPAESSTTNDNGETPCTVANNLVDEYADAASSDLNKSLRPEEPDVPQIHAPKPAQRKINGKTNSTQINTEQGHDPENSPMTLVGNCVALKHGTELQSVNGVKRGDTIVSRTEDEVIVGEIRMTCTIIGDPTIFVGAKFEKSLALGFPAYSILHYEDSLKEKVCKKCNQDKSVFIPINYIGTADDCIFSVIPTEENLPAPETVILDISLEANRSEDFVTEPMSPQELPKSKKELRVLGIDGRNNSCYADSMFFAMFAFFNNFDRCLETKNLRDKENVEFERNMAIINILKYDVINCLRRNVPVDLENVQKLRQAFAHYNPDCNGKYMDIEEFALILFRQILHADCFLYFDGDFQDFVYQIFVAAKDVPEVPLPTLQFLLDTSFELQNVKLIAMPSPAFIVKLPVSEGNPTFPRMYPNPEITIENICNNATDNRMSLRAVICLKNSHFTCFVRVKDAPDGSDDENAYHWIYHDSMPTQRRSRLARISNFEQVYSQYKSESTEALQHNDAAVPEEKRAWIDQILATAYMCIYVPSSNVLETRM